MCRLLAILAYWVVCPIWTLQSKSVRYLKVSRARSCDKNQTGAVVTVASRSRESRRLRGGGFESWQADTTEHNCRSSNRRPACSKISPTAIRRPRPNSRRIEPNRRQAERNCRPMPTRSHAFDLSGRPYARLKADRNCRLSASRAPATAAKKSNCYGVCRFHGVGAVGGGRTARIGRLTKLSTARIPDREIRLRRTNGTNGCVRTVWNPPNPTTGMRYGGFEAPRTATDCNRLRSR